MVFYTQDQDRFQQVSWAVFIFGAALILQANCNPFIEDQLNRLEFLSLATMFSVMFIGTLFLAGGCPQGWALSALGAGGLHDQKDARVFRFFFTVDVAVVQARCHSAMSAVTGYVHV